MKEEFKPEVVRERMREKQKELLGHLSSWIGKTNAENAFVSFAVFLITRWLAERLERGSASSRPALVEFAAFHLYPHFGKSRLEDEVKAILVNPAAFAGDPLRKEFAKTIVNAPPPPRAEPVNYRQWGEGLEQEAVMQMERACLLPVSVAGALMPDAHVG